MTARDYLESRSIPGQIAPVFGLKVVDGQVVIPVRDPWGAQVALLLRAIDTASDRRYTTVEGAKIKQYPFGLDVSKKAANDRGYLLVVEGAFDAIASVAAGIPAVACLGSALSKDQAFWISRYTDWALVVFDRGELERRNAETVCKVLRSQGVACRSVEPPFGLKDLGEAWSLDNTRGRLNAWAKQAVDRQGTPH